MSDTARVADSWHSPRLGREVDVVRWGDAGTPVLFFPTAAGDAEEVERFLMLDALAPLLEAGRLRFYSVDSVPGQVWLTEDNSVPHAPRVQNAFDEYVAEELVPAIHADCGQESEIVVTGASIGAYNALAAICRHPDLFSHAICLSGTYELSKFLDGEMDDTWYRASPLHFVPDLPEDDPVLQRLRQRFVLIAHGTGRWESPEESWSVAACLGARGVPNRVDEWGDEWDHDWPVWRQMLPQFLDEILPH
jgi:esterase/lipase superfamily enzyme